ncbi:VirB8 family type IV secretion system protein [Lysobacter xanthus]
MKTRSKPESSRVEHAIGRAVNYEVSLADQARRSERRAWWVAGTSCAISLILAGGYFYFLPLKEKVPYLVMADAYTGTATVARLDGNWGRQDITLSEAVNKSNVAHFVLARESYDIALMRLRDWTTVYTMSAPSVASGYTALHGKENPDRPYNTYGEKAAIRIKILSITLINDADGRPTGATVRFQRTLHDKASGRTQPLDSKIATLAFTYKANLAMDEKYRIENPLGFQVTSYRVDNDYAESPPVEPEIPAFPMPDMGEASGTPTPQQSQSPAAAPPAAAAPATEARP